jgi:phage I-like protein
MTLHEVMLFSALPDGLPTEFPLFFMGKNDTSKGELVLDDAGAKAILEDYAKKGVDSLPFDVAHNMLKNSPDAAAHKAYGWFVPALGVDAVTGRKALMATEVQWTSAGAKMLEEREMRYHSPAVWHDAKGRIVKLTNVALTNLPATRNQRPLVLDETATENKEKKMQVLLDSLGATDEAGAVVKVAEFRAQLDSLEAQLSEAVSAKDEATKAVIEAQAELANVYGKHAAEKRLNDVEELIKSTRLRETQKNFALKLSDEDFGEFVKTLTPHKALTTKVEEGEAKLSAADAPVPGADFVAEDLFPSIGE